MVYSRGVVLTHEVNVRDRRQVASRHRTAQLCRRLPQDLGRMPLVLGYSFVLNFFFICEFVERVRVCTRSRKVEAGATWWGRV